MKKTAEKLPAVAAYINSCQDQARKKLEEIRRIVRELAPEAEERISHDMPAFSLNGNLVYFAGFAAHIGFYPGANGVAAFKSEIAKYKHAKGSVQFPLDKPLPVGLIKKIVKYKLKVNAQKERK